MCMTLNAQTPIDLSNMTQDEKIGRDCSSRTEEYFTQGDINLNGFTLTLRNVYLTVNGSVYGEGTITGCGDSSFCVSGNLVNNPTVEVQCITLSVEQAKANKNYTYNRHTKALNIPSAEFIKVYDLTGKELINRNANTVTLSNKNPGLVIIVTDRYSFKLVQ